ncbi:Biopolymer transport protein ExbD/TolR [Candidatus Rhodobacter oscarellae]|uniref:Biopolymer transport protein ExbD/TolR n=1 Tax=Candidatus Rhodobacter oscarellae TaxID=1675527 RepID=A0A0J9E4Q1_9RHOB|nr:biopolymer transporter ExbD [Candidatus Rhodobacter lobularis]KMW57721.1 Biopolymer transport protein ExbD/TolR [Candidatus Rhodobacter lobularis]
MRQAATKPKREPTIALINVVFLMLVFFMVVGTIAPPLDSELALVETQDLEGREPPDALVVHADMRLTYRGAAVRDASEFLASRPGLNGAAVRIVPDRALPAADLLRVAQDLRRSGAGSVMIVTERALQ